MRQVVALIPAFQITIRIRSYSNSTSSAGFVPIQIDICATLQPPNLPTHSDRVFLRYRQIFLRYLCATEQWRVTPFSWSDLKQQLLQIYFAVVSKDEVPYRAFSHIC